MKTLPPQPVTDSYYSVIEAELRALIREVLFAPLVKILRPHNAQAKKELADLRNSLWNSVRDVTDALKTGKIQFYDGVFSGEFTSAVSRELRKMGAKWNRRTQTFYLAEVPLVIRTAAKEYETKAADLHARLKAELDSIAITFGKKISKASISVGPLIDKTFNRMGLAFDVSPEEKEKLKREYTDNLKLYVKKFTDEQIKTLRGEVEANSQEGYRFDELIDKIQDRYGVSESKAKFLARQETTLFVSKVREQKFESAGISEYIWDTAGDRRVRPDHKKLDGRKFRFDDPPVIDQSTGERGNPGQGYNCRCISRALIPEYKESREAVAA